MHGDILQFALVDTINNLALKVLTSLRYNAYLIVLVMFLVPSAPVQDIINL